MQARQTRILWAAVILSGIAWVEPLAAQAKKYKRVDAPLATTREEASIRQMFSGNVVVKDQIDKVVNGWVASFTREEEFPKLADRRGQIKLTFLVRSGSGQAHDYLVQKLFDTCVPLLSVEYHPITRVEAALLLGELNKTETISTGTKTPAVPFAAVLDVFLEQLVKPDTTEAVQAALLLGIDRHCRLGQLDDKRKEVVQTALLKYAADGNRHLWNRRRAVRALGGLRRVGPKNETVVFLSSIMADSKAPLVLRGEAARALGLLDLRDVKELDLAKIAYQAARVVLDAAKASGENSGKLSPNQQDAFRQVVVYVYTGFHGVDYKEVKGAEIKAAALLEGIVPDGVGLIAGAAKSKVDIHNAVTALVPKIDLINDLMLPRDAVDEKDLGEAIGQLDAFLEAVAGPNTASTAEPAAGR